MTTLFDIAGIQARIHNLPDRPPFMLAADLAEVYGTTTRRINESVKRNPARFPSRYTFLLSEAEFQVLRSQNATAKSEWSKVRFEPRVFTHGGANMLSGVLKSAVANEMAVAINDAFTAMEAAALADAKFMLAKLRSDVLVKKPIYARIKEAAAQGWALDQLWKQTYYPRYKIEQAVRELVAMKILSQPLAGMQKGLFDA